MHTMDPQGPKYYIFGDHFCSKNARKLKFHVFLHFNTRKHTISSFYLKWTEFKRDFYQFSSGPRELTIETKLIISSKFSPL